MIQDTCFFTYIVIVINAAWRLDFDRKNTYHRPGTRTKPSRCLQSNSASYTFPTILTPAASFQLTWGSSPNLKTVKMFLYYFAIKYFNSFFIY